jgi:Virulence factor
MTEYQITSWRALPSLVVARAGEEVTKVSLPSRFQEAIDEAAMRLGETGADAYLAGWERGPWTPSEGDPAAVAAQVATDLEERWDEDAVSRFLASLGPAAEDASAHG